MFLSRFSRISSSGRFIPEIDGLRFLAIGSVVLYHVCVHSVLRTGSSTESMAYRILDRMDFGVQLFFVISGFIISLPFCEHFLRDAPKVSLKKYYLRRLARLEPPYILSLLFILGVRLLSSYKQVDSPLECLLYSATYTHGLRFGERSHINAVAWTLEIEIQFYLIAPLLCFVFFCIRVPAVRRLALGALIGVIAVVAETQIAPPRVRLTVLPFLHYFLTGLLLSDLYLSHVKDSRGRGHVWDGLGILAFSLMGLAIYHKVAFLTPPLILVAYTGIFRGRLLNRLLTFRVITTIGGMCYSIYLYHYAAMVLVGSRSLQLWAHDRSLPANVLLQAAIMVPFILGVSAVLFLVCERPFMSSGWWVPRRAQPKEGFLDRSGA